ncbi:hypothetical protein AWL63_16125 [Sphingomonas panacis]|uniref:NIPSNAP domain-containing protein n=1 Tax=Sphingomonas panacis TaxID=1560345 RepID=A0A1B3ZCV8_9SPHN|nr:NIPSNAP family protein [Sphingomonas panacis]AOH85256.1 hypothetical protein AWL63_16125 [Sphingomonas panacis]
MIVEMRIYTLSFGSMVRYFELYRNLGQAIQWRTLGSPLGYYATEVGDLNQIVHLWRYASFADRAARRSALWQDAGWLAFAEAISPIIMAQESRLMIDAPLTSPEAHE